MVEIITGGGDLHQETCEATGLPRPLAKTLNFAIVYGAGPKKLMFSLGLSYEEAKAAIAKFNTRWPGVPKLISVLTETYNERGYIRTIAGRRLSPDSPHKLLNYRIQGSAAEIMKRAIVNIYHYQQTNPGIKSHMVSVVHDEIIIDAALSEVGQLHKDIPLLMRTDDEIHKIVPLEVECAISLESWADKMEWDTHVGVF